MIIQTKIAHVKDDVFTTTILQAAESGPNVEMEKPGIDGGKSIIVQRKRQMEVAVHPDSPWHRTSFQFSEFLAARPLVGIGSKGISARKWVVAATRDARHIHGTAVARLANIRKR